MVFTPCAPPLPLHFNERVILGNIDTISGIARGLNVKAPATIVVGEVVTVLHGSKQGLISDASKGMFAGVEAAKVARAAKTAAGKVDILN